MKFRQIFVVEGSGQFPYDMLRYDHCFPRNEEQSPLLGREHTGEFRRVELMRFVELKTAQPTEGRWRSFDWTVVPGSLKTEKI